MSSTHHLMGEIRERDYTVTARECASMRLLARDGWSQSVLKMTMHVSNPRVVSQHVTGECNHSHEIPSTDFDHE